MQQALVKRWKCSVCGYIYEGDSPPDICPVCNSQDSFEEYES